MFKAIIFSAALVGAATSANAVQILTNPSFETSSVVDGFVATGDSTSIKGCFNIARTDRVVVEV